MPVPDLSASSFGFLTAVVGSADDRFELLDPWQQRSETTFWTHSFCRDVETEQWSFSAEGRSLSPVCIDLICNHPWKGAKEASRQRRRQKKFRNEDDEEDELGGSEISWYVSCICRCSGLHD